MKNKIQNPNASRSMFYVLRESGATIVELLIYMGMFGILMVMLSQVFVSILDVRRESEAISYSSQDARFILARIEYDIKRAQSIATPASLGTTSSSLQLNIDGSTYSYALTGNNLTVNGEQLNSFNTTVSNLSFQRLGNTGGKNVIKLAYTVTGSVSKGSGVEAKTIQSTIGLR